MLTSDDHVVIHKMASLSSETYDPAATGLPLTYTPDTSLDNWKPQSFNQFVDGPTRGTISVRRSLKMVVVA